MEGLGHRDLQGPFLILCIWGEMTDDLSAPLLGMTLALQRRPQGEKL